MWIAVKINSDVLSPESSYRDESIFVGSVTAERGIN